MSETSSDREEIAVNQYLTFMLDGEIFAMDIASAREVLDVTSITRIPRTPEFLRGVINLRGRAVPVVDLRRKFCLPPAENEKTNCIIITEVEIEGEKATLGALADSVQEVFELEPEHIEPAPRLGASIRTDFIKGMGKRGEQFIIILDIDRIFSVEELAAASASFRDGDGLACDDLDPAA